MPSLTFRQAAEAVLEAAGEPLAYREILKRALERGMLTSEGQTPEATMNARLSVEISRNAARSTFIRTAPGVFGLRRWTAEKGVQAYQHDEDGAARIRVPHYPIYRDTALLLPVLEGMSRSEFLAVRSQIFEHRGTPQEQVDWSDPDTWIAERLSGRHAENAQRIWEGTKRTINPRHLTGHWTLVSRYELVEEDTTGILHVTDKGRDFLTYPSGPTVQEIDVSEGLDRILGLVAELGPASRADLLPPFSAFAREVSNLRADTSIKAFLWARLRNLFKRALVERIGHSYSVTEAGLTWIERLDEEVPNDGREKADLLSMIREQSSKVRAEIAERLSRMDPYTFEHLVKTLLEAMDYEDVEVTTRSGDGGVDVTARIQLGITEVVEVVQVKRHARNIQRHVLDALRGSLHRFRAVRGTIITTGGFARGTTESAFEPGAAPITLIDGKKLIDLMLEHDIGVQKRRVDLLEVDPFAFEAQTAAEAEEAG